MGRQGSPEKLAKMLHYILGRHPDEFALVPNGQGWVKVKELLSALSEEAGWGYVRASHLNEVLLTVPDPPVEILDGRIRARDRSRLPGRITAPELPKLMYTCVRGKAYPAAMAHGIRPAGRTRVILTSERALAERIGRRRDRQPVTLTVNVGQAIAAGVVFEQAGTQIFTAGPIPPGCFSGPPLPKEALEAQRPKQAAAPLTPLPGPGSFFLDPDRARSPRREDKSGRPRKESDRKKPGKRRRREPPPWKRD